MDGIKAFVGHSFSEDDQEVVRSFLDYLTDLAKSHSGFSWDHAEEAQPFPISQKVFAKFEGKNVFIGICTKREAAAHTDVFQTTFLGKVKADRSALQYKTSDWIIQEIGLAIGRGMKVILFVEDGVRSPGGLQGDTEYIPFNRSNPHKSFGKLLQMLTAVAGREATAPAAAVEPAVEKGFEEKENEVGESTDEFHPKPNWSKDHYEEIRLRTFFRGDKSISDRIDAGFRKAFSSEDDLLHWDAYNEYLRVIFGKDDGNIEKLKTFANQKPTSSILSFYVGMGYDEFGEHLAAAKMLEEAAQNEGSKSEKIRYLGHAAVQYAKSGTTHRAAELIEAMRMLAAGDTSVANELVSALQHYAATVKDEMLRIVLMEQRIELRPGENTTRFDLAYSYSQNENDDMSLYHYEKIPYQSRNPITWNNLGATFAQFFMPAKSISAFRNAEKENETLAMSNLGFKLAAAGFTPEAQALCDKALAVKPYHANVPSLAKLLKDTPKRKTRNCRKHSTK